MRAPYLPWLQYVQTILFYETCYLLMETRVSNVLSLVHPTLQCARDDLLRGTANFAMRREEALIL